MDKPTHPELRRLEKEYLKMNQNLSFDLIKYIVIGFTFIILNEIVEALTNRRFIFATFSIAVIIAIFSALKTLWPQRKSYELGITIFCILFYLSGIAINFYEGKYFTDPYRCFYFSYSYAIFERLLADAISNMRYRISFSIICLVFRVMIVPRNDIVTYSIQVFVVSIGIFLDIYRDRRNKHFFFSYYNSTEQLSKFKDLVVQHIPEAIVIVSQDLTRNLFVNNAFLSLVNNSGIDIQRQLNHFLVTEELGNTTEGGENTPTRRITSKTLLNFLHTEFDSETGHLGKHSCVVKSANLQRENKDNCDPINESYKLLQARVIPLVWEDQPSIAIILHDITQHNTIVSLKIADTQKDKVLATVSHELKTPLNGILGMIQIMEKKVKDEELLSFLTICRMSTNLLVSLVSSILDLNQIKANKIKLNIERIDIQELLKNILSLFEYQCRQKGIYLKTVTTPGTPRFLITDKDRLSQILINLVGNAQKFTSKGGITLTAVPASNGGVRFCVEDTGIGISSEGKSKLFQVYGRLDQNTEGINRHGVGLGLTIAESLVQTLNGDNRSAKEITVESEYGKGSAFSFVLYNRSIKQKEDDLLDVEENLTASCTTIKMRETLSDKIGSYVFKANRSLKNLDSTVASPPLRAISTEPMRDLSDEMLLSDEKSYILLVDDNLFNIAVAEHLVLSHGYKVKTALSGQSTIDLMTNNNHDSEKIVLILMDCQMPVMDGYETTRILRRMMQEKKIPTIPIVALTANDGETDKELCRKAGMCDHLGKPLKDKELLRILKKYS